MKRELAALETESPVSDNFGRKTRFGCSNGDSHRLVYKRVKRSLSSVAVVVAEEVKVEKAAAVVVEVAVSNGGGAVEVMKEEGKVEKERNLEEGEKENGDISVAEVEKVVVENVDGVSVMEVDEKGENRSEKAEEMVAEVGGSVEGDVSVKSVENGGVEAVASDNVVNGSLVSDEVAIKEKVIEETLLISPFKIGNGKGKKFGIERYQRRFTRSALKSNNVTEEMAKEDKVKEVNGNKEIGIEEKVKEMVSDGNAEVCKEEIVVQNHVSETTGGLVKDCLVDESTKRVTRSLISKPKEDGTDSCVTETSDSVVPDKENEELGASAENGMCDMDKDVEETETFLETPKKKLEIKMSKQIGVARIPTTVRDLFETGLLEGCPVYYDGGKGPGLRGRIRAIGICCPCNLCRGGKVIAPSLFEIHACNSYKRAVQYICLENGRSLIQILKACKTTRMKTLEETIKNAIGPLPKMVVVVCLNCKEPYSTMDAECADPVCSSCIMSNLSPVGPVYSSRKLCRSSSFVSHQQAASASGILEGYSLGKSVTKATRQKKSAAKSAAAYLSPKVRSSSRAGRMPEASTSQNTMKNSEEIFLVPKASSSPLTGKSVAAKTPKKLMKKLSKAALSPKPSKLTRVGKSAPVDGRLKSVKRLRKETLTPKASKTPSVHGSSEKRATGKITRKDIRLHKLVFEDDVLPDGTELGYYAKGKKLLDGYKKGPGIFCNCCETVVSASQFEAHAGCAARRKPYCYIYTSNGVSLHELSVNLIKGRKHSAKFNDDLCSICADGGNLLLCDGCPRAFHTECASLSSVPRGKWYCKYCENMFEREKFVAHNANAFAAGRVSGVDPMEQITKRSIRIVNNVGSEVSSCILCRGFDFCKSGFGPRTIILCDQCEKEYHVGCLKDHNMADLAELPEGKWFCSVDCGRIDLALQNLLVQGEEKLPESLVNIIKRKNLQNGSECATDVDVSWRLLSGKIASSETRPLLSQAVAIFHESFAPIVDVVSGHDLIPAMVYGRNVGGQEYGGMYCAVLTIDSVVVSAGIFRVFGPEVAELPLVATSSGNHGKGYFQALFACIERLLAFLNIKSFVLPAAEEAESIWTDRFGFKKMTPDQLRELKSNFWSMVRFQGTSMLHKSVPECRVIQNPADQD